MDNNVTKKTTIIRLVLALFSFALFVNGMYAFYYEYLRWTNPALVGLNAVFMAVAAGIVGYLLAKCTGKEQKKIRTVLFTGLSALISQLLLWGITYFINITLNDGKENELAMRIAAAAMLAVFAVELLLVFIFLFRDKYKIPGRLAGTALLLTLFVCAFMTLEALMSWNWTYPIYRAFVKQGGVQTANENIFIDFERSTHKLQPTDTAGEDNTFDIALAKNEREGFQLLVYSNKSGNSVNVEVTDFTDGSGNTLPAKVFTEHFTRVRGYGSEMSEMFPDALVPYNGERVELTKDMLSVFYIETLSTADSASGDYTATVKVIDGENTVQTCSVSAKVWDFALPQAPATDTAMGIFGSAFWSLNGLDETSYGHNGEAGGLTIEQAQSSFYKMHYDYLLEHGISAYSLPYDILDERADAYMSDPRVTSFTIPYSADDEKLVEYYTKVNSNPVWAEKGYFYPIDEPNTKEHEQSYIEITDRLERLCPGYNMVTPFFSLEIEDEASGETIKNFEMQCGRSNILCPESVCYDENPQFYELMQQRIAEGDKSWWYVCCGPTGEYCNMFIRLDSIKQRLLFWQEMSLDVTGLLYWDTVYYDKANPWEDSRTWGAYETGGDGCLIYPCGYIGLDEPVGTLRLKNIADGIEDYTILSLAEEKLGKEWVDAKIAQLVTSLTEYTSDYELLEQVRRSIAEELVK